MLKGFESVEGGMWFWEGAALCSVNKVNWAPHDACKDWSHSSRAVHLSYAGPGRGEWRWHPFWRGERLRLQGGMLVGVGASRAHLRAAS
jgi:hypothetical protein